MTANHDLMAPEARLALTAHTAPQLAGALASKPNSPPATGKARTTPVYLLGTQEVLARFRPIGQSRARTLMKTDPRFPKPVLGGTQGVKAIYSQEAIDAYFSLVSRDGFPHLT